MRAILRLCLCFLLLIAFSTCTKKDDPQVNPNPTPNTPTLTATLDQNSVTPGQVVVLTASADLPAQESWEILVGGHKTRAARLDARRASFLIPVLTAGPIALELSALGVKQAPALTMAAYTPITDAAAVLAAFDGRMTQAIARLDALSKDTHKPIAAQDVASVRSLQKTLATQWQSLTAAEQLDAAYVLQKMTFQDITLPQRRSITSNNPSEDFMTIGKAFVASMVITAASIDAFFLFAASPEPLSKFAAIAAAAVGFTSVACSFKLIDELTDRFDLVYDVNLFAPAGSNFGPTGPTPLLLPSETVKPVTVEAAGRTLAAGDAGKSAFLSSLLTANEKLGNLHQAFTSAFNRVKSWFGSATAPAAYVNPVKSTAATGKRNLAPSLLKLQNVSNSAISLTYSVVNNILQLKSSSATLKEKTPFTFEVVYENTELGINTKKTISAELEISDSLAFYQKEVLGNWTVKWYTKSDGKFVQEDKVVLQAGGTGKRLSTQYADGRYVDHTGSWGTDAYYDITWTVTKQGSNYYLRFGDNRWTTVTHYGRLVYPTLKYEQDLANDYYHTKIQKE